MDVEGAYIPPPVSILWSCEYQRLSAAFMFHAVFFFFFFFYINFTVLTFNFTLKISCLKGFMHFTVWHLWRSEHVTEDFKQCYWFKVWGKLKLGQKRHLQCYLRFLSTLIIRNVSWAANQHIAMISEGSCDTEDWCIDAENSAFHHRKK